MFSSRAQLCLVYHWSFSVQQLCLLPSQSRVTHQSDQIVTTGQLGQYAGSEDGRRGKRKGCCYLREVPACLLSYDQSQRSWVSYWCFQTSQETDVLWSVYWRNSGYEQSMNGKTSWIHMTRIYYVRGSWKECWCKDRKTEASETGDSFSVKRTTHLFSSFSDNRSVDYHLTFFLNPKSHHNTDRYKSQMFDEDWTRECDVWCQSPQQWLTNLTSTQRLENMSHFRLLGRR